MSLVIRMVKWNTCCSSGVLVARREVQHGVHGGPGARDLHVRAELPEGVALLLALQAVQPERRLARQGPPLCGRRRLRQPRARRQLPPQAHDLIVALLCDSTHYSEFLRLAPLRCFLHCSNKFWMFM